MKKWICSILFLGLCWCSFGAEEQNKTPASAAESAITKIARDYEAAYNKGDAAALGAIFAEDVEYTDEAGVLTSGRDGVMALLRKNFIANPGAKMKIQIDSVRSLTPDVAVERGTTLVTSRDGTQTPSAYTAVDVLKDAAWHIKQLVESPVPSPSPGVMLSELDWLVGTWKEKDGDADIETKVNWAKGNNFLTRNFKVTIGGDVTLEGWQIIGWDGADNEIRSWTFDSEGGFQEGTWTRAGNAWTIQQAGVLPDGEKFSSSNTLQRVNDDHCVWESTNRTLDGDPQPSLPRVEMVRVNGK
jgi:uncharacterized protein (TIGR02246 family)